MTKKRKVFITGAGGTIGRSVAKVLIAHGYQVSGYGLGEQYYRQQSFFKALQDTGAYTFEIGSIFDRFAMAAAMRGADTVIHLAAMVGGKRAELERLRCIDINVNGTDLVLASAVAAGISRFVMISSSSVYGEPRANPIAEDAEIKPIGVYAISKLAAEELTRGYAQLHPRLRFTIVRLFSTYGDEVAGHIALNAFAARVSQGQPPRIIGDGEQRRCYVHADDVAEAIAAILDRPIAEGAVYNLGNPSQVFTLNELAGKVIRVLASESGLVPQFDAPTRDTIEIRDCIANTNRAERDLDYRPRITVDEGLRRIAESMNRKTVDLLRGNTP
jgi:nucleoside-diphosphate-sugar epimerase